MKSLIRWLAYREIERRNRTGRRRLDGSLSFHELYKNLYGDSLVKPNLTVDLS